MRTLAVIVLGIVSLISIGCDVRLQPAVQGEWSTVHNDKDKVSKDVAKAPEEKHPETK